MDKSANSISPATANVIVSQNLKQLLNFTAMQTNGHQSLTQESVSTARQTP